MSFTILQILKKLNFSSLTLLYKERNAEDNGIAKKAVKGLVVLNIMQVCNQILPIHPQHEFCHQVCDLAWIMSPGLWPKHVLLLSNTQSQGLL